MGEPLKEIAENMFLNSSKKLSEIFGTTEEISMFNILYFKNSFLKKLY